MASGNIRPDRVPHVGARKRLSLAIIRVVRKGRDLRPPRRGRTESTRTPGQDGLVGNTVISPGDGRKIPFDGVLGVDPALDRKALQVDLVMRETRARAGRAAILDSGAAESGFGTACQRTSVICARPGISACSISMKYRERSGARRGLGPWDGGAMPARECWRRCDLADGGCAASVDSAGGDGSSPHQLLVPALQGGSPDLEG